MLQTCNSTHSSRLLTFNKNMAAQCMHKPIRQTCASAESFFPRLADFFFCCRFFLSDDELEEQPELELSSASWAETASPTCSAAGKFSDLQAFEREASHAHDRYQGTMARNWHMFGLDANAPI